MAIGARVPRRYLCAFLLARHWGARLRIRSVILCVIQGYLMCVVQGHLLCVAQGHRLCVVQGYHTVCCVGVPTLWCTGVSRSDARPPGFFIFSPRDPPPLQWACGQRGPGFRKLKYILQGGGYMKPLYPPPYSRGLRWSWGGGGSGSGLPRQHVTS